LERDNQTEPPETDTRWTQHPASEGSASGVEVSSQKMLNDFDEDIPPTKRHIDYDRLDRFLRVAREVINAVDELRNVLR
jgi:hypothetical protein